LGKGAPEMDQDPGKKQNHDGCRLYQTVSLKREGRKESRRKNHIVNL